MNTRKKIISGLLWRFAERIGAQGVTFFVSIILARLLSPDDYGTVTMVTVFTAILEVFVDSGMGNALIQKKDADDIDFSSVFYFQFIICILLYGVMYVCAPMIAGFYKRDELTVIVRIISLTIVIAGIKNIQQAYVSKHMMFKKFFYATFSGTVCSAVVGIVMAYSGFGVWALIVQQLSNCFIDTLILWLTVKWRPKKEFSWIRLKGLLSYGWKLLLSSLIDTVYNNLRSLIIGRLYSSSNLAYYNKGKQFPYMLITNINKSIDSVLFPTMSMAQDDKQRIRNMTRRAIKTSVYILAPLMIGLAVVAEPVVRLLLTDKWIPCVPFLRIFCISYMFYPIHTANLNAIKAMGRSDLFLRLEIIKKVIGMILLVLTMWHGPLVMAYSLLVSSVISQVVNSWPNRKLMQYSYLEQLKDIAPYIILSVVMGLGISIISFFNLPTIVVLILQVVCGMLIYIGLSALFRIEIFEFLYECLKDFLMEYIKRKKV